MSRHSDAKKARRKKRRDARDTRWVPDQVMDSILKAGEPAELAAMGIALKDGKDPATGEAITTWDVKR